MQTQTLQVEELNITNTVFLQHIYGISSYMTLHNCIEDPSVNITKFLLDNKNVNFKTFWENSQNSEEMLYVLNSFTKNTVGADNNFECNLAVSKNQFIDLIYELTAYALSGNKNNDFTAFLSWVKKFKDSKDGGSLNELNYMFETNFTPNKPDINFRLYKIAEGCVNILDSVGWERDFKFNNNITLLMYFAQHITRIIAVYYKFEGNPLKDTADIIRKAIPVVNVFAAE